MSQLNIHNFVKSQENISDIKDYNFGNSLHQFLMSKGVAELSTTEFKTLTFTDANHLMVLLSLGYMILPFSEKEQVKKLTATTYLAQVKVKP